MRKVQASYAVLALVNGIKIDRSAVPDAYIVHNDKLAGDLQAQQDAQEKARQAQVAGQAAADAWRDGFTPSPASFAQMQRQGVPDSYTEHNGKLSADIKAAHTAAEATRQAAVDAQEKADAWRAGFTPSPAALAQQRYPVLSHFVSHDQKADTWSDKQANVSHEVAYQGDTPSDYLVEPTADADLVGGAALMQKSGVPDTYTEINGKLSADIKSAHDAAETKRQADVDAQEKADKWRNGFTPSPAALAQQRYPVLSHFVTHDQKKDTWSDKQANVSHEVAYQGDTAPDYLVEPYTDAELKGPGSLVQRSKLIYPVKDSHSYISPYSQRDHSWNDAQHDASDEVKWVDNTKTLHADYVEQLDPSAEHHLIDGRSGVASAAVTALMQKRGVPDSYIVNSDALGASIKKTHTDAENFRQDQVDSQEAADKWRAGWTPSSGPVSLSQDPTDFDNYATHSGDLAASIKKQHNTQEDNRAAAVDAQEAADAWRAGFTPSPRQLMQRSNPNDADTYGTRSGNLANDIKTQHNNAETSRSAAVDAQEKADAWRAGSTPNSGPVITYAQARAIPDGYTFNNGVLSDSIQKAHTDAETARQASVDAQEKSDTWRNGWTANTGPVTHPYGLVQAREIPDGYAFNNGVLSSSLAKTQMEAEDLRQAAVDKQSAADVWRNGWTENTGPVYPYGLVQRQANPDGYTFNSGILSDSIKATHDAAEVQRQAAVDAQEKSDAWRKGSTPNSSPVLEFVQKRANPDGYTYNSGVLSDSIKTTHDAAEASRQASVNAEEKSNTWRNGWTANSGPVLQFAQHRANPDGYTYNNGVLSDSILKAHTDAETARAASVDAQEKSDAWRNGFTANSGPVINYVQKRANPDGYTFNNGVLSDSILKAHTDAETARAASVDAQEKSDAWRNGWTANSGPVISYSQVQNPNTDPIPDGYAQSYNNMAGDLKAEQQAKDARIAKDIAKEEADNVWRGAKYVYPVVALNQADPDGYTFNNGVLSASILKAHTDAETARAASVDAQEKSDAWRNGWTANSGQVLSLVQGQPGPNPTDYDYHNKVLNDKINTHNQIWWDEQKATVDSQTAIDAWRDGYTANTGPELPYSF